MIRQFCVRVSAAVWAAVWCSIWAMGLGACGGGSGGDSAGDAPTLSGPAVISGVAAAGAPLLGANIRVIDARGNAVTLLDATGARVTSLRSSTADGSFRLVLASDRPALPLLIQAAGVDGAGTPVVLHSALVSNTAPLTAHITPITEALVALVLGAAPRTVFDQAALASSNLPLLATATAVASASDLLKSVLATSLTDTKVANAKTLDLLSDSGFLANRLLVDAVLDGTRIQVSPDASGRDVLQISNKFTAPGIAEVSIDVATARAELLLATTGVVSKAITSTLKVASSPHKTSLINLATIDALTSNINKQIAQNASSATFSTALLGVYTRQDGRSKAAMADLLVQYAASNWQLGRWTLLGCNDDPIPAKGCTQFQAAALVINGAGQAVGVLHETLGNDAAKPAQWTLLGNGRNSSLRVQHVAQLRLNLDGNALLGETASNGLQLLAPAQEGGTPILTSATVQVPSGYSVRLVGCGVRDLCVSPGAGAAFATGELGDTLLQKTPGWIGSQDAAPGALYSATNTLPSGATELFRTYLRGTVATDLRAKLFPKPDTALSLTSLNADLLLNWKTWADANPDMQMKSVRVITNSPVVIRDIALNGPIATQILIPAPAAATASFQVWLGAQDSQGRMFYSQFKSGL